MNKFEGYKHKNGIDVGFMPTSVRLIDEVVVLKGWWFTLKSERLLAQDEFTIKEKELSSWVHISTSG